MKKTTLILFALASIGLTSCSMYDLLPMASSSSSLAATSLAPISVSSHETKEGQTAMRHSYKTYASYSAYELDYSPSVGETKLLIIPVWFKDSSTFINESKKETIRQDIQKAYLGTSQDTGWASVKTFYEAESMGRLKVEGTVSNWYEINESYMNYAPSENGQSKTESLVKEATSWYFLKNPNDSRKNYDRDGNGYLDGVMLIYAAPDYVSYGKAQGRDSAQYGNLWAYCYWIQDKRAKSVASPGANVFFWASYDFMYSSVKAYQATGKSNYGKGNNDHCYPDPHTYIHEMGHVFGLDDYYDYGDNKYCPAGGFSMQDYNVGGHEAFSSLALGWTDPYIPTSSCEITINAFEKDHDAILLTPEWNAYGSPFDEYLLLELYTPEGLNALDATYKYEGISGPRATGIRLWHVDARLLACNKINKTGDDYIYDAANLTSNPTSGTYGVVSCFTNSYEDPSYSTILGSDYDDYDLLHLIRNNTSTSLRTKDAIKDADLFGNGSSFLMSRFARQFPNQSKLNSNKSLGWSFSVTIQGSGIDATAKVTLTKE